MFFKGLLPIQLGSFAEQYESDDKQYRDGGDTRIGHVSNLSYSAYQHGTHKGCAFTADVIDAEVFAGFFGGDDLGEVGTGESLNGALEHPHQHGQEPELPLLIQLDGEEGDADRRRRRHRLAHDGNARFG